MKQLKQRTANVPYIKQVDRDKFDGHVKALTDLIQLDGELNYFVTALIHGLLMKRGVNYQNMNNLDGALSQIRTEFHRTVVGPYEKLKIVDNGYVSKLDQMLAEGKVPDPKTY